MRLSDLIDTPFIWCGHQPGSGLDCYGLAVVARKLLLPDAKPLPDYDYLYKYYNRENFPPTLISELFAISDRAQKTAELIAGDIILSLGRRGGAICTCIDSAQVIGFGHLERVEIMPIPALNILSCWRVH